MREMLKLFVVVALFSTIAGGLLATVNGATKKRIELQELTFVKGPAIDQILAGCTNKPLDDRFKLKEGDINIDFFVGEFNGKKNTVAFEVFGKGSQGDIGVMVGVNLDTDKIVGVGITTSSETPGLGSRAKDPAFTEQFKGMSLTNPIKIKSDGGDVDALSGATITSRGVCAALSKASEIYTQLKDQIISKAQA
jgi:Na+-translocating ferredoxin:NAD+ oxidoreductase subunit G